jgi:multidrug efflux system membrane fusion protein
LTTDARQPPPALSPVQGAPVPAPETAGRPRGNRRSRWARTAPWLFPLLGLAIAIAIGLFVLHQGAGAKAPPPPPKIAMTTSTATKGDIGIYLQSIGTVTPVHTASITSQVSGRVEEVHFQEGQRVLKGDPLIDIDARPYRATLLQAQGALERDQGLVAQAQMDLQRYREAWALHALAKQQLDDQEKLVLQDQGTVKIDEGTVQYDQVQVDYCHITAPFAGRVGLRLVDPGNVVQGTGTATTLAVITELEPITVVFTLAEDSLGPVQARLRQSAKLAVDVSDRSAQKKIASGTLLTLDNQIDTTTGTVKARAVFDNQDDALFPNQFVNTRLLVDTLRGVTLVPASVIQQNGSASFVYVIQNGVAHMRTVKPGIADNGLTQVDGIDPGDVLANSSFDRLHDGALVAPTGPAAPGAPSSSAAPSPSVTGSAAR